MNTSLVESQLEFTNNRLLPALFGQQDINLHKIEAAVNVQIQARGNQILITGEPVAVAAARVALEQLYHLAKKNEEISSNVIDAVIKMALTPEKQPEEEAAESKHFGKRTEISTVNKSIKPRSPGQIEYINMLHKHNLVFALGPAGTGKTYLAVATGVSMLLQGKVDRIIMSRPAVEAGEKLGYLPGDMREKVDPYLRPLYDALYDMLPGDQVKKRLERGELEVAPLAFMRGRTLAHAYVILDEAQNTTAAQMKMFLTRMGEGSYMVITGDATQIDLPMGQISGLKDAERVLKDIPGIGFTTLTTEDIVRHPLVAKIVTAYEKDNEHRARPD